MDVDKNMALAVDVLGKILQDGVGHTVLGTGDPGDWCVCGLPYDEVCRELIKQNTEAMRRKYVDLYLQALMDSGSNVHIIHYGGDRGTVVRYSQWDEWSLEHQAEIWRDQYALKLEEKPANMTDLLWQGIKEYQKWYKYHA